jgi:hypothetical protein
MASRNDVSLPVAARTIGISWAAAWRLLLTGKLDGYQVHGRWRITVASVENEKLKRARTFAGRARQIVHAVESDGLD